MDRQLLIRARLISPHQALEEWFCSGGIPGVTSRVCFLMSESFLPWSDLNEPCPHKMIFQQTAPFFLSVSIKRSAKWPPWPNHLHLGFFVYKANCFFFGFFLRNVLLVKISWMFAETSWDTHEWDHRKSNSLCYHERVMYFDCLAAVQYNVVQRFSQPLLEAIKEISTVIIQYLV